MVGILKFILTGTYLGKMPFAPGTWGTLWGIPFVYGLSFLAPVNSMAIVFILIILGVYAIDYAYKDFIGEDPQEVVWDEILGYAVSMTLLPNQVFYYALAFIVFRLFDTLKPYPISYLDKNIKGGMGVMLDDILAGIFTNVLLHFVVFFWGAKIHGIL